MRTSPTSVGPSSTASAELRHYHGDHGVHAHGHAQLLFGVGGCLEVEVGGHSMRVDASTVLEVAMDKSLHEDWPAARMATQFALSVPQFHVRWRLLTGQTPQAWLRERRLNAAERLLRAAWPADTVASQVDYAGASALLYAPRRERAVGARDLRRA